MKVCKKCKIEKPSDDFYKRADGKSPDGRECICGECIRNKKRIWYQKRKYDLHPRYLGLIQSSKIRGLECSISEDEFREILSKGECYYCKADISTNTGSALDRLDCKIGYIVENVVPCCKDCNLGKGDRFSSEDWKVMIDALIKHRSE